MKEINAILEEAILSGASDIHLTDRKRPVFRINGVLTEQFSFGTNTPEILRNLTNELVNDEDTMKKYEIDKYIDASTQYADSRFRIHIFRQKGCDAIVLRLIPVNIPTFGQMNLPPILRNLAYTRNGLVIVTGTTGSGKSTTLAAMIDEINRNSGEHIVTVEDPIEFVHEHKKSIINQREVGNDVISFADAVKSAMREDPDILLIGEMRDLDTISNAITMAETGHLVFATLHTKSVAETVDRIIDIFPAGQQEQVRMQLANSIQAIVSQELLPKIGGGRVPCCEIMVANDAIRNLIREGTSPSAIYDQMDSSGRLLGSQTRTKAMAKLVQSKLIAKETALKALDTKNIEEFERILVLNKK